MFDIGVTTLPNTLMDKMECNKVWFVKSPYLILMKTQVAAQYRF